MPAYNAAAHIELALGSLMDQTFRDIEIIVSDNASTDATPEIVRTVAAGDSRVRYIRQPNNIGANKNYTFVARAARGSYFKWASSNDWCAPTFLERCLERLESNPDAVVATPRTRLFENDLSTARDYGCDIAVLEDTPLERVISLASGLRLNNMMNGLIRTSALQNTGLIEQYYGADIVLMGHLALLGKILLHDDRLFYRRLEVGSSTALQDAESIRKHHYPTPGLRMLFQNTKHHIGWLRAAMSAPMTLNERTKVIAFIVRRAYWHRGSMLDDLDDAATFLRNLGA